ncbi:MAG TPA: dihydrofolate reductase [Hyphomicrobiaceae bacterium]|nr:dihydrofolate reductase [Hyphomicrobiaceae bacterium]
MARLVIVVAAAENGVIGRLGRLPWRLPTDLRQFRRLTLGKPVIMGRKTYDSIGKPLDGRENIVLTRASGFHLPRGVHSTATRADAIALGQKLAAASGADEVAIIGGADIFRAALPMADRIYFTLVHGAPKGDVTFGPLDPSRWVQIDRKAMPKSENDDFTADFIVFERKN